MCNEEDINFESIAFDLLFQSRSQNKINLWHKKGLQVCHAVGFGKYWRKRFNQNPASKNFICSVWKTYVEKNSHFPVEVLRNAKLITDPERIKQIEENYSTEFVPLTSFNSSKEIENTPKNYPSVTTMAQTFAESIVQWAKKGFKVVNEEQFNERLNICKGCDLFDEKALNGSGRCRECGCSTQAKLRIATERCPKDKWIQV